MEKNFQILPCLIALFNTIKPDLMFSTSLLLQYMTLPSKVHFGVAKCVLRYLKSTPDYGIWFEKIGEINLYGYYDSDWDGCVDNSKNTSKYVFFTRFKSILLEL